MNCTDFDVIVVGGGAAGLACAVKMLKSGKNLKICLVDAGERLGKKLAATGNGQGNISNTDMAPSRYHGGNASLVEKIACADAYAGARLFDCILSRRQTGFRTCRQSYFFFENSRVNGLRFGS